MPGKARAAIDPDALLDRSLSEISVADLIQAVSAGGLRDRSIVLLPDKKKYELWVDEGPILKLPLREVLEKLRGEKKKLELELPFDILGRLGWPVREVFEELGEKLDRRTRG
jgi:hypothetical protein